MKVVGVIYLVTVMLLILLALIGWPSTERSFRLIEQLLAPDTLAALTVGLGGEHFSSEIKGLLGRIKR